MPVNFQLPFGNLISMLLVSASFSCAAVMDLTKSAVFFRRAFKSSKVTSVSSCFGTSTPAKRAAAPLAVSQAICIWRTSGCMSGYRRDWARTAVSNFFVAAWAAALSSRVDKLFKPRVKPGIKTSYIEIDIDISLSCCICSGRRFYSKVGAVMLPFSAACERNKDPILEVLRMRFAGRSQVLEIGSGTGQHAVHFARSLGHLAWHPTEQLTYLADLAERVRLEGTPNLR